jgi:hypothetical protein
VSVDAALKVLSKMEGVGHLTDANLKLLHDCSLVALMKCQEELRRRGAPSGVVVMLNEKFNADRMA